MAGRLDGKVAIITGAAMGLGAADAELFASEGAQVVLTDIAEDEGQALADKLGGTFFKHNVTDEDRWIEIINETEKKYGRIDILVNNAGIKKDNLLMRMEKDDFDAVINTNLSSVFNLTKASIKTFLKQRSGSIINISSVVGVKGNAGQSNYSASKAGIIGFSKSVALELGSRNIRSNVIAPGFIETDMTDSLPEDVIKSWKESIPLKRGGNPSDVGNACVFLASDLSSYITGQVLHVDGGMLT